MSLPLAQPVLRFELRGGLESTVHGFATVIGPLLIFVSFFGAQALSAALWATMITAVAVPAAALLLKGNASVLTSTRAASLTAYASLILQLSHAAAPSAGQSALPGTAQFVIGLAAGNALFALSSLMILAAGVFKLGNVFKMIPSTVTAGISNSTAIVLVWLAAGQIMNNQWQAALVAAAMVSAFALWSTLQERMARLRLLPNVLMAVGLGLIANWLLPLPVAHSEVSGNYDFAWMGIALWPELAGNSFGHLFLAGIPGAMTLTLVMILESLTAAAVMESRFGLRVDVNRELVALGGSNLLGAVLGGVPCTGSPLRSLASWLSGGRGSLAAWVSLLMTGLALVVLGAWLLKLPAGMIAGLFLLQAPIMVDPTFKVRLVRMMRERRLTGSGSTDLGFWLTMVITLAGFFGGLIWATFLGIALSGMMVLRKLSGSLTSRWAYMDQYRSRRVRSAGEAALLNQLARQAGVLRLTGHLFFGNSTRLVQLADELPPATTAVVIDVSLVQDADPSGLNALSWLLRALAGRGLKVVLSGEQQTPAADVRRELEGMAGVTHCIDLDRGLEVCEEHLLALSEVAPERLSRVEFERNALLKDLKDEELAIAVALLKPLDAGPGELLFRQGDPADGIWLLQQGQLSILTGQDEAQRLATFGPGQFMGEMGYVDGGTRSANARADTPLRAALLNHHSLTELATRCPNAARQIVHNIARELSHRVRANSARSQASDGA